jgi:hypothetical protein
MADFTFSTIYLSTFSGGIATISEENPGPITITAAAPLEPLDTFTIGGQTYTFIGYNSDNSILIRLDNPLGADPYYLLSNDDSFTVGQEVTITQEAFPYCLLAGSLIATPTGERPVEDIRIGDLVLTADGDAVPVRWVGRQSFITMFAGPAGVPVLISAGALGDNVPSRDLCVSADHAILIDGYLICAQALVNGTTITTMAEPPTQLDYYHLELDTHRIILANGTPVESFVDDVSRAGFDNYQEWVDLGLEPQPVQSLGLPRVKSARQLPAGIVESVAERAPLATA